MPQKQRANTHSSRTGTNGQPIKATHQEHNFTAEHVNPELTPNNKVLLFQKVELDPDYKTKFEQDRYEQAVYKQFFQPCLDSRNAKAEQGRHKERVQTMQQFRQNKKACPEEVQFIIGNVKNPTDPETLWKIYLEYTEWHKQAFPNILLLNAYLHADEPNAAPHIHQRQVWTAHDGDMLIINQSKALEEMGIERPFPDEEVSRTNNAKVTYSQMCRAKQIEIARAHGLNIEDKPREPSENGKTLLKLKMQTMQAENERLKSENAELQGQARELSQRVNDLTEQAEQAEERTRAAEQRAVTAESSLVNLVTGVPPLVLEEKKPKPSLPDKYEWSKRPQPGFKRKMWDKGREKEQERINAEYEKYCAEVDERNAQTRQEWENKYLTPENLDKARQIVENRLKQSRQKETELDSRENALRRKETAQNERERNLDKEVEKKVTKQIEGIFDGLTTDREQRLRYYCDTVKFKDGTSVLDRFEKQEQALRESIEVKRVKGQGFSR